MPNLRTLIALGLVFVKVNASIGCNIFGGTDCDEDEDLINLDIDIHHQSKHESHNHNVQLQSLSAASGDQKMHYIEKDLKSHYNIQISSTVYIGSDKQPFQLIFDTGSSWLWVGHDLCENCANQNKFQSFDSRSFHQKTTDVSSLHYGKGSVIGYDATDEVCMKKDSTSGNGCMEDYLFKAVVYQEDLGGLAGAGLVGLAPSSQYSGSQLFVPSLYEQGAIKKNMFAMYIDHNDQSKIQMGGYDLKKFAKPGSKLRWYPITTPMFWQIELSEVTMGGKNIDTSVQYMMADTGTSLNMLPDKDFNAIKKAFLSDLECEVLANTLTSCECTDEQHARVPDIDFKLGGDDFVYKIPRDEWFAKSGDQCIIKFMHGPNKRYWILGLNFFTNYYTVFDYENKQIGFVDSIIQNEEHDETFLDWASSGTKKHHKHSSQKKHVKTTLLNLAQAKENTHDQQWPTENSVNGQISNWDKLSSEKQLPVIIILTSFIAVPILFIIYYLTSCKNKKTIKATVVQDEGEPQLTSSLVDNQVQSQL